MNIVELETQNGGRDWPLIVMSVSCPICGAGIGQGCITVASSETNQNPMTSSPGQPRIDFHADRKYSAATLWNQQREAQQAAIESESKVDAQQVENGESAAQANSSEDSLTETSEVIPQGEGSSPSIDPNASAPGDTARNNPDAIPDVEQIPETPEEKKRGKRART